MVRYGRFIGESQRRGLGKRFAAMMARLLECVVVFFKILTLVNDAVLNLPSTPLHDDVSGIQEADQILLESVTNLDVSPLVYLRFFFDINVRKLCLLSCV